MTGYSVCGGKGARNSLIGTMGILLLAKRRGLLDNVTQVLNQMRGQGTRISDKVYVQILTLAQEIKT